MEIFLVVRRDIGITGKSGNESLVQQHLVQSEGGIAGS